MLGLQKNSTQALKEKDDLKLTGTVSKEERLFIIERELQKVCSPRLYEAMVHHIRHACFQWYGKGRKEVERETISDLDNVVESFN